LCLSGKQNHKTFQKHNNADNSGKKHEMLTMSVSSPLKVSIPNKHKVLLQKEEEFQVPHLGFSPEFLMCVLNIQYFYCVLNPASIRETLNGSLAETIKL
jgi:hypothetical protein